MLADTLTARGLRLVSGGTDNHLILVDLTALGITGKVAEGVLEGVGITVNKNALPFDTRPPMVTSGIRIGTPAVTSRGMKEDAMEEIGGLIAEVLSNPQSDEVARRVSNRVSSLIDDYPLYPDLW